MHNERNARGLNEELHPASNTQQYMFDVARSQFTSKLAENLPAILAAFPDVNTSYLMMRTILKRNPAHSFRVFRPEDASMTLDADSNTAFLR